MRYGISAAAIVVHEQKLLLMNHVFGTENNFWVPPGGRLEGQESIFDCAQREAFEETGLHVTPEKIVYIQEFAREDYHFVKFFIWCQAEGTAVTLDNLEAEETFVKAVRFIGPDEMHRLDIRPSVFRDHFWDELKTGLQHTRYLGLYPLDPD